MTGASSSRLQKHGSIGREQAFGAELSTLSLPRDSRENPMPSRAAVQQNEESNTGQVTSQTRGTRTLARPTSRSVTRHSAARPTAPVSERKPTPSRSKRSCDHCFDVDLAICELSTPVNLRSLRLGHPFKRERATPLPDATDDHRTSLPHRCRPEAPDGDWPLSAERL